MIQLTRQVRFAVNAQPDEQLSSRPSNSYGGFPSLFGLGHFFMLDVTLAGELNQQTNWLVNIKQIDQRVREIALPIVEDAIRDNTFGGGATLLAQLFQQLRSQWPGVSLEALSLRLTPFLALCANASELPMISLSQKFEFSASHRLYNPSFTDEQNRAAFGKCSNPHGHGHNYELQVTLRGQPDAQGTLIDVPAFERVVSDTVIEPLDHKNLNIEVPQFREIVPSVENIAKVIYQMLKPKFQSEPAKLASVTVWETPKTWCEYSEQ